MQIRIHDSQNLSWPHWGLYAEKRGISVHLKCDERIPVDWTSSVAAMIDCMHRKAKDDLNTHHVPENAKKHKRGYVYKSANSSIFSALHGC